MLSRPILPAIREFSPHEEDARQERVSGLTGSVAMGS
jgi:hypothetical protein